MFVKIKESVEEKLRKLCAGLSPEKRVPAIVMLAALFAIGNFYMIFRAIHDIGREDVRPEIIEIRTAVPIMKVPGGTERRKPFPWGWFPHRWYHRCRSLSVILYSLQEWHNRKDSTRQSVIKKREM